jgi:cell division protein FtsW
MKNKLPAGSIDSDFMLMSAVVGLVFLGTLMVFSSSVIMADVRWHSPYSFFFKQLMWVAIGSSLMWYFTQFDYRTLQKYAKPLTVAVVILLGLALVIGTAKLGAKRWLKIGPFSMQPSELAKYVLVIALADYIDRKKSKLKKWEGVLPALAVTALFVIPILLEPDLGTPLIMCAVAMSLLFVSGASFSKMAVLAMSALPLIAVEIYRKPYRLLRIKHFIESLGDISSTSYQLNQSILALGSGGFFGKGLGQGQMKLLYLPEAHTDFIFPVIGEELGFVGAAFVIALFVIIAWRGWRVCRSSDSYFGSLVALGITLLITYQAILNISVACGLAPTKGLALPFVSFGGSSLLFNMAAAGVLLNISKKQ